MHDQYTGFMIDNTELHTTLDGMGYYANEVDRLQEDWDVERSFRTKRPSISDLKAFLTKKLITLDNFLDELRGMGYHERYISLYANLYSGLGA